MKTMKTFKTNCLALGLLALLVPFVTSGCGGYQNEVSLDGEINGDLLAAVDLDTEHRLEFYEFEPGVVAIRESFPVGEGYSSQIDLGKIKNRNLAEIYTSFAKAGQKQNSVQALRAAQIRSQEYDNYFDSLHHPEAQIVPDHDLEASAQGDEQHVFYSPDYYGDNYGAEWFLDSYCNAGGFRYCPTNASWAYSGRTTSSWFKTCAMAADFEVGVQFWGGHRAHTVIWPWVDDWSTYIDWDYQVRPRKVECWTYTGTGRRESRSTGLQPSPRTHFSALRN